MLAILLLTGAGFVVIVVAITAVLQFDALWRRKPDGAALKGITMTKTIDFAAGRAHIAARAARTTVAQAVAEQLKTTERDHVQALRSSLKLVDVMIEGREQAQVSVVIGHDALERAAAAVTRSVQGLGDVVAAHARLLEVSDRLHLPRAGFGDGGDCPEPGPATFARSDAEVAA